MMWEGKASWRVAAAALFLSAPDGASGQGVAPEAQDAGAADDLLHYPLEDLLSAEATSVAKRPQRIADTAAAIYVITQEDIRRSGARSVAELMRLAPGVETGEIDGNSTAVSIRGFNTRLANSVLVLIDGRAVYLSALAGVMWDQLLDPLDTIERIEVVRGPGGAVWGANAVNGVINIITKSAARTPDTAIRGRLGGDGGDVGLRVGGGRDDTRFRLTASGRQTATMVERRDGGRDRVIAHGVQLGGQSDTILDDTDTLTLRATAAISDFHPQDPANRAYMATGHASEAMLLARWSRRYTAESGVTVQAYLDQVRRSENGTRVSEAIADLQGDLREQQGGHEIGAGFDLRRTSDHLSSRTPALDFSQSVTNDVLFSAYAQDGYWLIDRRLHGWVGAKAEHSSVSGLAIQPSARLLLHMTDRLTVWGAWSRAVRTPSMFERTAIFTTVAAPTGTTFYSPIPVRVVARGTPDLRASQLMTLEAGLRVTPADWLSIDVAGYRNIYRDLIGYGPAGIDLSAWGGARPTADTPPLNAEYRIFNNSAARSLGLEVVVAAILSASARLDLYGSVIDLSYRLINPPVMTGMGDIAAILPQIPPLSLSTARPVTAGMRLRLDPLPGLEFDGSLRCVGAMQQERVASRVGLDVRLGWNADERTSLSLIGRNLFDGGRLDFRENFPTAAPALVQRQVSAELTRRF